MKFFSPYWLITQALPGALKAMSILQGTQVNNLTQDTPNQLTTSHNWHTDINTTGISAELSTHTENTLPSTQTFLDAIQTTLDEAKQINASNNNNAANIIDNYDLLYSRSKRFTNQNKNKHECESINEQKEKVVKLDIVKDNFIDVEEPFSRSDERHYFIADIRMHDDTFGQLPSVIIKHSNNQYAIGVAPGIDYPLSMDDLYFRLEKSTNNQAVLTVINKDGESFINSTRGLPNFACNQLSQIRAPNNIHHYPHGTIFNVQMNGTAVSLLHNSTKVSELANTQVLVETYSNNDNNKLLIHDGKEYYLHEANNFKIHITKNTACLYGDDTLITDISLKPEDILNQKFLDKQFSQQVPVTCGDQLSVNEDQDVIFPATITMPNGQTLELPYIGYHLDMYGAIDIHPIPMHDNRTHIYPGFSNLERVNLNNTELLSFCNNDVPPSCIYTNEGIPHIVKKYPLGTRFQLDTSKGKLIIRHNNNEIGTFANIIVFCRKIDNDKHIYTYIYDVESDNSIVELQEKVFAILEDGKGATIKTYKVGDKDTYIKFEDMTSRTNLTDSSITKADDIQLTTESAIANAPTTASSPTTSKSTTVSVTATSIATESMTTESMMSSTKTPDSTTTATTTKQTPASSSATESSSITSSITTTSIATESMMISTKMPDSILVNNTEDSKLATIETILETTYSSITMLPENSTISNNISTISNNISTIEVTNTNNTGSADTPNNNNTNYIYYVAGGVTALMAAIIGYCYYFWKPKEEEEEYEHRQLYLITEEIGQSTNTDLQYETRQKHKLPLPPIPLGALPSTQQENTQDSDTTLKGLEHHIPLSNNHGLPAPIYNGSTPNNALVNELDNNVTFLYSQIATISDTRCNNGQENAPTPVESTYDTPKHTYPQSLVGESNYYDNSNV